MTNFEKSITTAGITIFVAYVVSVIILSRSAFDSAQRGAGHGAVAATASLDILWAIIASIYAVSRWRETAPRFRTVLALNAALAIFLVASFLLDR
jgi:hypothetical protein